MFVILMAIGLFGLAVMALPALGRHGAIGHAGRGLFGHAHGPSHGSLLAGRATHAPGFHAAKFHGAKATMGKAEGAAHAGGATRFIPSPRVVFSFLALYGAFGNALMRAAHVGELAACFAAAVPALLVERFAVTPLWNLLLRFQAAPTAPLEELILCEAWAVTPFRNGKGLVSVVREGRRVQLAARLTERQAKKRIEVGERLVVEDVDAQNERLTVSFPEE